MASYLEATRFIQNKSKPPRVTHVSGDPVLNELIAGQLEAAIGPDPSQRVSVSLEVESDKHLWAEVNQTPPAGTRRMVLCRAAHRMSGRSYDRIQGLLEDRLAPNSFVIFLSDKEWPVTLDRSAGRPKKVFDHPEVRDRLLRSGLLVSTNLPQDVDRREAQAAEIISSWGTISRSMAAYMYRRTGSLAVCRDVMLKAALLPGEVTERVIDVLAPLSEAEGMVEAILACDKPRAATLARTTVESDIHRIVARLEQDTLTLGSINRALRTEDSAPKLAERTGVPIFRILALHKHASMYDPQEVGRRLKILSTVPRSAGALEAIALTW